MNKGPLIDWLFLLFIIIAFIVLLTVFAGKAHH